MPGAVSKKGTALPSLFSWSAAISQPLHRQRALLKAFSVILKIDEIALRRFGETVRLPSLSFPSSMLKPLLVAGLCLVSAQQALAQETIYRCGNEYINDAALAKRKGCKPMEGGNITVIEGIKPQSAAPAPARSSSGSSSRGSGSRMDSPDQRARDSDARAILQSELAKARERLAQAKKAYANGEPEKQGIEGRNYQRYLDRVAELKAAQDRAESDVNSIQRELDRFVPSGGASNSAQ